MKTTKQYIAWLLLVVLTAGLSSCIKEDYTASTDETATVNLYFTRSDNAASGDGEQTAPAQAGEGIKTLRVIIVDQESQQVDVNELRDFSHNPDPVVSQTLTILGLPVGTKDFYIIANEASVGLDAGDFPRVNEKVTIANDPLQRIMTSRNFPRLKDEQVDALGLPIAGVMKNVSLAKGEDKNLEIPITHAVAKIVFRVKNTSSTDMHLTGFEFGKFFANRARLFAEGPTRISGLDNNTYGGPLDLNVVAGAEPVEAFTCYLYENAPDSRDLSDLFTVALTNSNGVELEAAKMNLYDVKRIDRNMQVDVLATINREAASLSLECTVKDWEDGGSFDMGYGDAYDGTIACTSEGRISTDEEGGEAYAVVYGSHNLTFDVTITKPVGATWTANLSNGHDFEVVKTTDGSTAGGGIDGNTVSITVRPKAAFEVGTPKETDLYITIVRNGEVEEGEDGGKQLIDPKDEHPGDKMNIRIRQVSLDEWNGLTTKK